MFCWNTRATSRGLHALEVTGIDRSTQSFELTRSLTRNLVSSDRTLLASVILQVCNKT